MLLFKYMLTEMAHVASLSLVSRKSSELVHGGRVID